jgi:IS5 family transposase
MRNRYNLSGAAMEEAPYEISSVRLFAGPTLDKTIPDQTTIMNLCHLLKCHNAEEFLKRNLIG